MLGGRLRRAKALGPGPREPQIVVSASSIAWVLMMSALPVAAQTKPNFTGIWQLNLERSTFRGPAPKELLVRIQHDEPILTQVLLVVTADGREQQQTFMYDTAGGAARTATPVGDGLSRAQWNGAELIIDSVLKAPNGIYRFRDHWSRSADGRTLTMAHLDDDLAGQVAVFERASPEQTARFKPQ